MMDTILRCFSCQCNLTDERMPTCFECQLLREDAMFRDGYDQLMVRLKLFANSTVGDVRVAFDQFIMQEETGGVVKVVKGAIV
ncbi:MAG: hypothetical protein WC307_06320 [Candidatus Nanoarchaeia archaeon]